MRSVTIIGAVLVIIVAIAQPIAQQGATLPVPTLPVPFQETDISMPGHEAVTGVVDFAPGATTGRHIHGGDMIGYLVSGSVVLDEQDRLPPRVLNAGDTFIIPARAIHSHTNRGQSAARMFVTYIVDKSKAVTSRVQ